MMIGLQVPKEGRDINAADFYDYHRRDKPNMTNKQQDNTQKMKE